MVFLLVVVGDDLVFRVSYASLYHRGERQDKSSKGYDQQDAAGWNTSLYAKKSFGTGTNDTSSSSEPPNGGPRVDRKNQGSDSFSFFSFRSIRGEHRRSEAPWCQNSKLEFEKTESGIWKAIRFVSERNFTSSHRRPPQPTIIYPISDLERYNIALPITTVYGTVRFPECAGEILSTVYGTVRFPECAGDFLNVACENLNVRAKSYTND